MKASSSKHSPMIVVEPEISSKISPYGNDQLTWSQRFKIQSLRQTHKQLDWLNSEISR